MHRKEQTKQELVVTYSEKAQQGTHRRRLRRESPENGSTDRSQRSRFPNSISTLGQNFGYSLVVTTNPIFGIFEFQQADADLELGL